MEDSGRRFGGLGAAIPAPSLLIEATRSDRIEVAGTGCRSRSRAGELARERLGTGGALFRVHRAIPPHAGLGSGTQLGLAVARALAELYDVRADARRLPPPPAAGIARRSGPMRSRAAASSSRAAGGRVGTGWRRCWHATRCRPSWRYVVAIPDGPAGPQRRRGGRSVPAAAAARRAGGGAGRAPGVDAAPAFLSRVGPRGLRRGAVGDPAHYRRLVRTGPRRRLCAGTDRDAGGAVSSGRRAGRRTKLMGSNSLCHRRGRGSGPGAGGAGGGVARRRGPASIHGAFDTRGARIWRGATNALRD